MKIKREQASDYIFLNRCYVIWVLEIILKLKLCKIKERLFHLLFQWTLVKIKAIKGKI